MPSAHAILAFIAFCCIRSASLVEENTMPKETGSTQREASAILQSKKNRLTEINTVERMAPANGGIKWENAVSRKVQSAMMVLVRSARSFFPK